MRNVIRRVGISLTGMVHAQNDASYDVTEKNIVRQGKVVTEACLTPLPLEWAKNDKTGITDLVGYVLKTVMNSNKNTGKSGSGRTDGETVGNRRKDGGARRTRNYKEWEKRDVNKKTVGRCKDCGLFFIPNGLPLAEICVKKSVKKPNLKTDEMRIKIADFLKQSVA